MDGDDNEDDDYEVQPSSKVIKQKPLSTTPTVFPQRRPKADSEEDDYAVKSHKRKVLSKATPESVDSGGSWRRGAAKKVVTYDETRYNDEFLESASETDTPAQGTERLLPTQATTYSQMMRTKSTRSWDTRGMRITSLMREISLRPT